MSYRIKFTTPASAFAKAKWSVAAVEEQARGELAELSQEMAKRGKVLEKWRGFHTMLMPSQSYSDKNLFICTPCKDEQGFYVEIDTSTMEDCGVLEEGPFKGYKLSFPGHDTE